MNEAYRFFVAGTPRPGGSKKGFFNKRIGRVMLIDASKHNEPWRNSVINAAKLILGDEMPLAGPLKLTVMFTMPRPQNHYGCGKNAGVLKSASPVYHTVKPDTTKLLRPLEDALTDIRFWHDDTQVALQVAVKRYGEHPGAEVIIEKLQGNVNQEIDACREQLTLLAGV